MKSSLFILILLLTKISYGQVSFSNVEINVDISKKSNGAQLKCSTPGVSVIFKTKRQINSAGNANYVLIDSQIIQVVPVQYKGLRKELSLNDQKKLLYTYSENEVDYLKNDLNIEVSNYQDQWVVVGSGGWHIWYFRQGLAPIQVDKRIELQLFASTVIGDQIFTLNAPLTTHGDFKKASYIINELMESMIVSIK